MIKEIDGVKIHYETSGDSGSRILLLHGWGCSIQLMKPVADRITGNHRFMIIDFPGHGESSRPPEPWGVPEYSECLLRFLRETVISIGQSLDPEAAGTLCIMVHILPGLAIIFA